MADFRIMSYNGPTILDGLLNSRSEALAYMALSRYADNLKMPQIKCINRDIENSSDRKMIFNYGQLSISLFAARVHYIAIKFDTISPYSFVLGR